MSISVSSPKRDGNQYYVAVTVEVKGQRQTTRAYGVTQKEAKMAGDAICMSILYNIAEKRK